MIPITIYLEEPRASNYFNRSRETGKTLSELINADLDMHEEHMAYLASDVERTHK